MTTVACYSRELSPGSYVFAVGKVRIPVRIPAWAHGVYQTMTISGHAVRFFVGVTPQCARPAPPWLLIGLGVPGLAVAVIALLLGIWWVRRPLR